MIDEKIGEGEIQGGGVDERDRSQCIELYDTSIQYADREIGRLLIGLSEIGFLNSVVIAVTADHGESFGESGLYDEHGSAVQGAAPRIPLMISAPGIGSNRLDSDPFSLEDLMPTLLALLQVPQESWPKMDGQNHSARVSGMAAPTQRSRD